ncbi:muramoyltetrapeptide carboxypeptidase [Saccharopolyspora antimicrobica]|uniref:Muramoyltetrapeptide carboxypeptidase n=1 Tax=Saccharopolyspora antimicrobica TaxID=455193 RepID=A0A1I5EBC5_9PSEU|nr:LD-carboxypeptidase [Saccharopolyspora antimicrobica]RKT86751.1 muramoyltetrapeptide carboxypeptidase [Saccharopolyspora antimicrobica]SFO08834.1 muramoyltetrapeptide carboxypeptidase [Saccharopolyspora antimicrobica]
MSMRELRRPPRLRSGDTVAVVAPAGPVPEELLDAGLAHLRAWGLQPRVGKHVRDRHPGLDYLAGTDADRAADLQEAWCDPDVSAVLCARGGYGSMRVLDHLDWAEMAAAGPKVFTGSSDITALHDAVATQLGLVTVFGPMVATKAFAEDAAAREHLRRTLFQPESVTILTRSTADALVRGRARGTTYGGNLSIVAASLGAPDAPTPPERGIALLEDITESPYQLDRFLTQLLRAGWFDHAAGIALGSWTECGPLDAVRAVMSDRLGGLGVPILWELGFGHCTAQRTVPLGVAAELDTDAQRLSILKPALL